MLMRISAHTSNEVARLTRVIFNLPSTGLTLNIKKERRKDYWLSQFIMQITQVQMKVQGVYLQNAQNLI